MEFNFWAEWIVCSESAKLFKITAIQKALSQSYGVFKDLSADFLGPMFLLGFLDFLFP